MSLSVFVLYDYSPLSGTHTNMQSIFSRSASNNGFKVFDEVRLIGISQLHYHPRPIHHFAPGQSFSHFVESVAFDHPLRTDKKGLEPLLSLLFKLLCG